MELTYQNLNQALIGISREVLKHGVARKTRGFDCIEFQEPVTIKITNPTDRYINIPERKWAKTLPFVESLWIASGTNHMELVGHYAKNMYTFSDDQQFMRAAYGPRIRCFSGFATDYKIQHPTYRNVIAGYAKTVDQLKFVVESLQRDIASRQALITIHDPVKDDYDSDDVLKVTKDTPCCRSLQFLVNNGKLDCILTIRSNDLIWGFSAVNVFNFTFMQEYVANILGLPVGNYYHIANNLHFYEDKRDMIETFAALSLEDYESEFGVWQYDCPMYFDNFDRHVTKLFNYEEGLRKGEHEELLNFGYDFIDDWAKVFYKYHTKKEVEFVNPYLNKLFKK